MAAKLRAVKPGETVPGKPKTIIEAIDSGDRLAEMAATHRRIGLAVQDESTPARDLASLTRRQMEISKEIEALRRQKVEEAHNDGVSGDEAWSEEAI